MKVFENAHHKVTKSNEGFNIWRKSEKGGRPVKEATFKDKGNAKQWLKERGSHVK